MLARDGQTELAETARKQIHLRVLDLDPQLPARTQALRRIIDERDLMPVDVDRDVLEPRRHPSNRLLGASQRNMSSRTVVSMTCRSKPNACARVNASSLTRLSTATNFQPFMTALFDFMHGGNACPLLPIGPPPRTR
ncbi:hypothetical protein WS95_28615 [Burkholderia sp. MSMB1826]|nr:hypothetical protein WS95_28615 [Burkholderia sp. MSMB1826]KVL41290.1 hypothetical protein WS96_02125 [Burkholderia sp. MSMB1835]